MSLKENKRIYINENVDYFSILLTCCYDILNIFGRNKHFRKNRNEIEEKHVSDAVYLT